MNGKSKYYGKLKDVFSTHSTDLHDSTDAAFVADLPADTPDQILEMIQEYERIKKDPRGEITGWDFDRAFAFLEKYPETHQAEHLVEEMLATNRQTLKGLSYESARLVLETMPDHPGAASIIRGMYKLEREFIKELRSGEISFILEIAPDHPERGTLSEALVMKNLTNAYHFIEANPLHPQSRFIIEMMFDRDPNIATLLLKEKMDHAQVEAIFEGIYGIDAKHIQKMMPDALIFILEIAPDHKFVKFVAAMLVKKNYIKAFDFVKENENHPYSDFMKILIGRKKPSLKPLLEQ